MSGFAGTADCNKATARSSSAESEFAQSGQEGRAVWLAYLHPGENDMIRKPTRYKLFPMLRHLRQLAAIVDDLGLTWDLNGFILAARLCASNDSLSMRVGIPNKNEAK